MDYTYFIEIEIQKNEWIELNSISEDKIHIKKHLKRITEFNIKLDANLINIFKSHVQNNNHIRIYTIVGNETLGLFKAGYYISKWSLDGNKIIIYKPSVNVKEFKESLN